MRPLTDRSALCYIPAMVMRNTSTRKYTRRQIEVRMDRLAIKYQQNPDPEIVRELSTLSRMLARMDGRLRPSRTYH